MHSYARALLAGVLLLVAAATPTAQRSNAAQLFADAKVHEAAIRKELDVRTSSAPVAPLLARARTLVSTYEDLARLFPASGYSDNALWQGGMLAADTYWEFGEAVDRTRALQLLNALTARYPTSSLVKQVGAQTARLTAAVPPASSPAVVTPPAPISKASASITRSPTVSILKAIRRDVLPGALRVTLELEREATFEDERIEGPSRVFIDLQNTASAMALSGATLTFPDDVVRQIRVGRQIGGRTRVVLDLAGASRHSVYALYNPYRVVVDIERPAALAGIAPAPAPRHTTAPLRTAPALSPLPASRLAEGPAAIAVPNDVRSERASVAKTLPVNSPAPRVATRAVPVPAPNANGGLSLSRQLGLGVTKIVIDAGHGGHDPGAQIKGLNEADLTLDVALRLEKLLLEQAGVEVVLTRRGNTYVPLEERTAIANREEADLFLSIHANASDDPRARGIETYFLNFAPNPQAEAIAARENAGSVRNMRSLPDIVKAIALNDKINESRDFASMVQASLLERLKKANRVARNLGVKQAPFMVLIGATMPSVLAELSFLTHQQESSWLRTPAYRQQLAEALLAGIVRYQRSLKGTQIAAQ
jgi:N-acetylmuramoyl-L-alanine amidase